MFILHLKILKLFSSFGSPVYFGTVFPFVYARYILLLTYVFTSHPILFIVGSRTVDLQLLSRHHTLCKLGFILDRCGWKS